VKVSESQRASQPVSVGVIEPGSSEPPDDRSGLAAEGLTKTFGSTTALSGITTTFVRGLVHGLIGENGSGKSTFVKVVTGIYRPDLGGVTFDGRTVANESGATNSNVRIACVYQDGSLIEELTVAQNLDLIVEPGLRPNGDGGSWHRVVLDNAQLSGIGVHTRAGDLPNNEKRLVEIAAVLARRPDVILFDESTSTLDERGVEWVLASMRQAAADGACVVFVTHRLHEVLAVTSDITVLRPAAISCSTAASWRSGAEVSAWSARPEVVTGQGSSQLHALPERCSPGGAQGPVQTALRRAWWPHRSQTHKLERSHAVSPTTLDRAAAQVRLVPNPLAHLGPGRQLACGHPPVGRARRVTQDRVGKLNVNGHEPTVSQDRQCVTTGVARAAAQRCRSTS